MKICEAINCENTIMAKGLCSMHYYRRQRGMQDFNKPTRYDRRPAILEGDIAKIPLGVEAKQGYAIVDAEYVALQYHNWTLGTRGYPVTHVDRKTTMIHHLILGKPPTGFVIDHINRNPLDNRIVNLRFVSQRVNATNKKKQRNNTSGHVGVTYSTNRKKWIAQIVHNRKNKFLGHFNTKEEAIAARKAAELASDHFVESMNLDNNN